MFRKYLKNLCDSTGIRMIKDFINESIIYNLNNLSKIERILL